MTPDFQERYSEILSAYLNNPEERYLLKVADLGRELVQANVPPEDIAEIHENALADMMPDSTIADTCHLVSAPLMELLMAYGLAFREQLDSRRVAADNQRLRNEQLQALVNIAGILSGQESLEEKEFSVMEELAELLQSDAVTLRRIDETGKELVLVGWAGTLLGTYQPPISPKIAYRAFLSGKTIVVNNYPANPEANPSVVDSGIRSLVCHPVAAHGQVYGTVNALSNKPDHFTDERVQILTAISDSLGVLLENARLTDEAQERAQEIQRLSDHLTRILNSNPSAMAVLIGSNREVASVNTSFCEMLGLDEKLVVGRPICEVLPWDGLELIISESLSSRSEDRLREMSYQARDGGDRWLSVSAVPLLTIDKADPGEESLLVLSDITEQKQQQQRLQEHSRLASVGELAAGVAHEINNPLAAILGLSELIQMENPPSGVTEDAQKIQDAAQRAARIVQNLLSFARKHEPEKLYIDVASVVDRAIDLKSHDFRFNNIGVIVHHSDRVPKALIDEQQMIQVMLNILTNSQQAIMQGPGSGEIEATTRLLEGKIRITIADNGPGIPPETLPRIFDPFFTTKQVGEGTGLGLSICYGIIREHGGELWVESKPGEGASFHIELPLSHEGAPPEDGIAPSAEESSLGKRILVADDEPVFRDTMLRALTNDGHDVLLASNGQEAWNLIQIHEFDIIFADLRMPGIDGQKLYQMAREVSKELADKLVFITGDTASATASEFLGALNNPVLSKPFKFNEVQNLIRSIAEHTS